VSEQSNLPIQQNGNVIRIGHMEDPELRRGVSVSYEVIVPAETKLRSQTGSGTVIVEGIRGPVNASTGSGSVTITRIGDEVRAHTGSGRMQLDAIRGNLDAHTGSGSIHGAQIGGRIVAHTGSGGVTIHTAAKAGFELRAHTGSGHITVDRPMTVHGTVGHHELMAKVGGGGNAIVDVRTGSGSIRIQ
jgi:DUF4097 and DUF4098 domain-containing protein YvlB